MTNGPSSPAAGAATPPVPRPVGTLSSRLPVAVGLLVAFGFLSWADATGLGNARPAWWILPVAVAVAWAGADEATRLLASAVPGIRAGFIRPATAAPVFVAAAGAFAAAVPEPIAVVGWAAFACIAASAVLGIREIVGYRPGSLCLARWAAGTLVVGTIGMPLAFLVGLRLFGAGSGTRAAGLVPLVSAVAVVKGGDIAAYCVGSLVGRRKLAPALSPGKTWEGACASLVASLSVAWLMIGQAGGGDVRPWGGWIVYGLAVGVAGMVGDLGESLVKRELGAKDSGRSLGGLGGVLDLFDALVVAAPVAWLLWTLGGH